MILGGFCQRRMYAKRCALCACSFMCAELFRVERSSLAEESHLGLDPSFFDFSRLRCFSSTRPVVNQAVGRGERIRGWQ